MISPPYVVGGMPQLALNDVMETSADRLFQLGSILVPQKQKLQKCFDRVAVEPGPSLDHASRCDLSALTAAARQTADAFCESFTNCDSVTSMRSALLFHAFHSRPEAVIPKGNSRDTKKRVLKKSKEGRTSSLSKLLTQLPQSLAQLTEEFGKCLDSVTSDSPEKVKEIFATLGDLLRQNESGTSDAFAGVFAILLCHSIVTRNVCHVCYRVVLPLLHLLGRVRLRPVDSYTSIILSLTGLTLPDAHPETQKIAYQERVRIDTKASGGAAHSLLGFPHARSLSLSLDPAPEGSSHHAHICGIAITRWTMCHPSISVQQVTFPPHTKMVYVKPAKRGQFSGVIRAENEVLCDVSWQQEYIFAIGNALVFAAACLLENRPANTPSVQGLLPIVEGGRAQSTISSGLLCDLIHGRPSADDYIKGIKCRKAHVVSARCFLAVCLHCMGGNKAPQEAIAQLLLKITVLGDRLQFHENDSETVLVAEFIVTNVATLKEPAATAALCDAACAALSSTVQQLENVLRNRSAFAQSVLKSLSALKRVFEVMPMECMLRAANLLRSFMSHGHYRETIRGCEPVLIESVQKGLHDVLRSVFHTVGVLRAQHTSPVRPHSYVQREFSGGEFILHALSLLTCNFNADDLVLLQDIAVEELASMMPINGDFTRSTSFDENGSTENDRTENMKVWQTVCELQSANECGRPNSFGTTLEPKVKLTLDKQNWYSACSTWLLSDPINYCELTVVKAEQQKPFIVALINPQNKDTLREHPKPTKDSLFVSSDGQVSTSDGEFPFCTVEVGDVLGIGTTLAPEDGSKWLVLFHNGVFVGSVSLKTFPAETLLCVGAPRGAKIDLDVAFVEPFVGNARLLHASARKAPTLQIVSFFASRMFHLLMVRAEGCPSFLARGCSLVSDNVNALVEYFVASRRNVVTERDKLAWTTFERPLSRHLHDHLCSLHAVSPGAVSPIAQKSIIDVVSRILSAEADLPSAVVSGALSLLNTFFSNACAISDGVLSHEYLTVLSGALLRIATNAVQPEPFMQWEKCDAHATTLGSWYHAPDKHQGFSLVVGTPVSKTSGVCSFAVLLQGGGEKGTFWVGVATSTFASSISDFLSNAKDVMNSSNGVYCMPDSLDSVFDLNISQEELQSHKGSWVGGNSGRVFGSYDAIIVTINWDSKSLSFLRNGRPLGTLYRDFDDSSDLVPLVCMRGDGEAMIISTVPPSQELVERRGLALEILGRLSAHPDKNLKNTLEAFFVAELEKSNVVVLQALGSDGNPLSLQRLGSNATVLLEDAVKSKMSFAELQGDYASELKIPVGSRIAETLAKILATHIFDDDASLSVLCPRFALRALRVLSRADVRELPDDTVRAMFAVAWSLLGGTGQLDADRSLRRCWEFLLSPGCDPNAVTTEKGRTDGPAAASRLMVSTLEEKCCRCKSQWHQSSVCTPPAKCHRVPLYAFEADSPVPPDYRHLWNGRWNSTTSPATCVLTIDGSDMALLKVTGKGSDARGPCVVSGTIRNCFTLDLKWTYETISSSQQSGDSTAVRGTDEWNCPACTLVNSGELTRCACCNTVREGSVWVCPQCTYAFTSVTSNRCEMCGFLKKEQEGEAAAQVHTAVCLACKSTIPIGDLSLFKCRGKCPTCKGESEWRLTEPLEATLRGRFCDDGVSFSAIYCLKGYSGEVVFVHANASPSGIAQMLPPLPLPKAPTGDRKHPRSRASPPIAGLQILSRRLIASLLPRCDLLDDQLTFSAVSFALAHGSECLQALPWSVMERLLKYSIGCVCAAAEIAPPMMTVFVALWTFAVAERTIQISPFVHSIFYAMCRAASLTGATAALSPIGACIDAFDCLPLECTCKLLSVNDDSPLPILAKVKGLPCLINSHPSNALASLLAGTLSMQNVQPLPALFDGSLPEVPQWTPLANTQVEGDNLVVGQVMGTVECSPREGKLFYYEAVVPPSHQRSQIVIGWGRRKHALDSAANHVGTDDASWGYNMKSHLFILGAQQDYVPPSRVNPGDVIGALLNFTTNSTCFSVNGVLLRWVDVTPIVGDEGVFPFVSASVRGGSIELRLSNTQYLPDGYRDFTPKGDLSLFSLRKLSAVPPRSYAFYESLCALVDELHCSGVPLTSLMETSSPSQGRPWEQQARALGSGFPCASSLINWSDHATFGPYLQHLITMSDLAIAALPRLETIKKTSLWQLYGKARYTLLYAARWSLIERELQRTIRVLQEPPEIILSVPRSDAPDAAPSVFSQFYRQIAKQPVQFFRSRTMFAVKFRDSIATDGGGLYRAAFAMVSDEIMSCSECGGGCSLFRKNSHSAYFNVVPNTNATSENALLQYCFLGRLLGNVTLTGTVVVAVSFPRLIWKLMLEEDVSIEDYYFDVDDTIRLSIESDEFLMSEGFADLPGVESDNPHPSAAERRAQAIHGLLHQFDKQIEAVRSGFCEIVPQSATSEMTWSDLQRRVCGKQTVTAADFLDAADLTGLPENVRTVFVEAIKQMSDSMRSRFLLFCSGQQRLPIPEKIQIHCGDDCNANPTAHTCSPISLRINPYANTEKMVEKLQIATAHAYEYGFV